MSASPSRRGLFALLAGAAAAPLLPKTGYATGGLVDAPEIVFGATHLGGETIIPIGLAKTLTYTVRPGEYAYETIEMVGRGGVWEVDKHGVVTVIADAEPAA